MANIEIIPFKEEHFWAIDVQPAQAYVRQYAEPGSIKHLEDLDSFTIVTGEKLLACVGWINIYPTRALMWGFLSATSGPWMHGITKVAHRMIEGLPHKRVEIEVDCEFEEGHRWARIMGFKKEVERLKCYRMDGGDSTLYSLVRP